MYNKLFTKILDSSIWLAPDPHRLVWITLIAAMDQDSLAPFACAENLAARARVSLKETEEALAALATLRLRKINPTMPLGDDLDVLTGKKAAGPAFQKDIKKSLHFTVSKLYCPSRAPKNRDDTSEV